MPVLHRRPSVKLETACWEIRECKKNKIFIHDFYAMNFRGAGSGKVHFICIMSMTQLNLVSQSLILVSLYTVFARPKPVYYHILFGKRTMLQCDLKHEQLSKLHPRSIGWHGALFLNFLKSSTIHTTVSRCFLEPRGKRPQ